ncbi:hypothetical protein [Citrobacter sp. Igbk 14]|uniref:hypothetical protein n=1 Tax=Citrobacter sp. Igbk 14 TaxID=2963960 RepID=UPI0023036B95|nr:hypothetical protein [Citrobacter sp. Igbk 14]MDA8514746.1 hypothetical protein [Citrobacter sp. Igbk 14]
MFNFSNINSKIQSIVDAINENSNKLNSRVDMIYENNERLKSRIDELDKSIAHHFGNENKIITQLIEMEDKRDLLSKDIKTILYQHMERLEFIREELMFEFRVKTDTLKDRNNTKIESLVLNNEKYENQNLRRINVGCGHVQPEGYINVDARQLPGIDVICDAGNLFFDDQSLDEIYSAHLIEHFTEVELSRVILPNWLSKLKKGGVLRIVTPDANSMINDYVQGIMSFEDLRKVTYGAQDYEGDFHYNMFSVDYLIDILSNVGFTNVELIEDNRRNGLCREMELIAVR